MKTISNQTLTIRAFITTILIVIASLLLCLSCSVTNHADSNEIVKTRIYVGKYQNSFPCDKTDQCIVLTSDIIVRIQTGEFNDSLTCCAGSLCYIDIKPCLYDYHPQISHKLDGQWLVILSDNTESRYRIINNHKF